jgi:hypothetical protein
MACNSRLTSEICYLHVYMFLSRVLTVSVILLSAICLLLLCCEFTATNMFVSVFLFVLVVFVVIVHCYHLSFWVVRVEYFSVAHNCREYCHTAQMLAAAFL